MTINYWNKDKKNAGPKKRRINWQQSLKSPDTNLNQPIKIKKSLQYN